MRTTKINFWYLTVLVFLTVSVQHLYSQISACSGDASTYLDVQAAPYFANTVTNYDASVFDFSKPGSGKDLFTITLTDSLLSLLPQTSFGPAPAFAPNTIQLAVFIQAKNHHTGKNLILFDIVSQRLNHSMIDPQGKKLTSHWVLWEMDRTSGSAFEDSFAEQMARDGAIPEIDLTLKVGLLCNQNGVDRNTSWSFNQVFNVPGSFDQPVDASGNALSGKLRLVQTLLAQGPGFPINSSQPELIFTTVPTFYVVSDLFNTSEFNYGTSSDKIRIYVYEVKKGASPLEAIGGREVAAFDMDFPNQLYPLNLPLLTPGKAYVWRARAKLIGKDEAYKYSDPLYFQVAPIVLSGQEDPGIKWSIEEQEYLRDQFNVMLEGYRGKNLTEYGVRVLVALKKILGDEFLTVAKGLDNKIPEEGKIWLNGKSITLGDLESLAEDFSLRKYQLSKIRNW